MECNRPNIAFFHLDNYLNAWTLLFFFLTGGDFDIAVKHTVALKVT